MTEKKHLQWTYEGVLGKLTVLLGQVAPLKVTGPVSADMSLAEDLDFDSLDVVDMLIAVNDYFSITIDFESWISEESSREARPFTIGSFCLFIMKTIKGAIEWKP